MLAFATEPIPHDEAVKLIADKPIVTKEVFDQLPQDLKPRAFTITGIEDFDVLQAVRDRIAEIPAGANWGEVKKDVIAQLSPWMTPEGAENRAKLLMRHHAFSAYAAAQAKEMDELADVFPFRQYISTEDAKVRPSHAAINGLILPADHRFWDKHTPPWEFNCRCDVVELTEQDRNEEEFRDKKRPVDQRRILKGPALDKLEKDNQLVRGVGTIVDLRTPKEKGGNYELNVRDLTLPYEDIKKRWDKKTQDAFESWASGTQLEGSENSLLGWLTGKLRKIKPGKNSPAVSSVVRKSPVSKALSINYKTKAHQNPISETIGNIDLVHDDGQLHDLPFEGNAGKALGAYTHYTGGSLKGKGKEIAIKSTGAWPRLTTAHEIGHFLDHQGIGAAGIFETEKKNGLLAGVLAEIDNSRSIAYIKGNPNLDRNYLLDPKEKWARAYAQYIAKKSGDDKLNKELKKLRKHVPWQGWNEQEFEPIEKAIDEAFTKLGWDPKTK